MTMLPTSAAGTPLPGHAYAATEIDAPMIAERPREPVAIAGAGGVFPYQR